MWAHIFTPPATLPKLLVFPPSFSSLSNTSPEGQEHGGQSCRAPGGPERAATDLLQQGYDEPLGGGLECDEALPFQITFFSFLFPHITSLSLTVSYVAQIGLDLTIKKRLDLFKRIFIY